MSIRPLLPLLGVIAVPGLFAQIGDRSWEGAQTPLPAARRITPSPALSAQEELRTFQLPPGFHIELVADETLVQDPVAAAFDGEGNLWVCQDTRYNSKILTQIPALAAGEKSVPPSKVVRLESSRRDGRFDRRSVWLDGLDEPRGIAVVHDGVIVADPPKLWLVRKTGEKKLLADNAGIAGSQEYSGSILWGRDNVLHTICDSLDYRYQRGALVESPPVPIRGQFGLSQDDFGRLYFNNNSDQLRGDLYAAAYAGPGSPPAAPPWVNFRVAASQETWPSHPTPAVNRGYRRGELGKSTGGLRDDGTLLEFTAACSPLIYRGENFPAGFYGNAFVPDASANLIKRNLLLEAEGRIVAVDAYQGREFLTSTDTRFRPVALVNAPDGTMLVLDMYRGIIEGVEFLTSYLHEQSLARGLDRPMYGLGRIWKVVYDGGPREPGQPDLPGRSGPQLAALLDHPDAWWRDAAEQELVERGGTDAVPALQELARHAAKESTRVYALWTLDGLNATSPELLRQALGDPSAKVRAAAVRLHERWLEGPEAERTVDQLSRVLHDPAPEVSVQLALTLGRTRTPAAKKLLAALDRVSGELPFMAEAIALAAEREHPAKVAAVGQAAKAAPSPPLSAAEHRIYEAGQTAYLLCAACHQPGGTGLPNIAPSLVSSPWVGADPRVLARIVLNGKEGTPGFPSTMPPLGGALSDGQIAAVLTYIRNSWGLHYSVVSPETVAKVRREVAGRQGSWTNEQLQEVRDRLAGKAPAAAAIPSGPWRAGLAAVNITPEKLIWMTGFASRSHPAAGTGQDLWAKALVLEDPSGHHAVLLTLDLCGITRPISDRFAAEQERRHQVPARSVMVNASHTHSGPDVEGYLVGQQEFSPSDWADIVSYRQELERRMLQAAEEAWTRLQPVTLSWGVDLAGFAVNRRNNKERDVPALRQAGQLRGPVDDDVPVLSLRAPDGRIVALLFSYSCHNTTLKGYEWSGDWAGFAKLEIERRHPGTSALFVQGCAGNINALPRGLAESKDYGRQMADAVDRALGRPMAAVHGGFSSAREDITLRFASRPTPEALGKARRSDSGPDRAWAARMLAQEEQPGGISLDYSYPMQAWRLGELVWLGLGGEPVVDYELRLQREHGPRLWVFGYCNDVMAYIPTESVLAEGGYEGATSMILYGRPSPWAPGLEAKIDAEAGRLLQALPP